MIGPLIDISKLFWSEKKKKKKKKNLCQVTTTTWQQFNVLNSSFHIESIKTPHLLLLT